MVRRPIEEVYLVRQVSLVFLVVEHQTERDVTRDVWSEVYLVCQVSLVVEHQTDRNVMRDKGCVTNDQTDDWMTKWTRQTEQTEQTEQTRQTR